MINEATESLIAAACDPAMSDQQLSAAVQKLFEALGQGTLDDANAALKSLSSHFDIDNLLRAAFLALVCGALVERGCDASLMAEPLTDRLHSLLKSSAELVDRCEEQMPSLDMDDTSDEEDEVDYIEVFEGIRQQCASPEQQLAWEVLDQFWQPAIAVYSVDPQSRRQANHLVELATAISEYHQAGHWLRLMLTVFDEEPILAIEPQTMLGISAEISGIVDNFQLNVLLMDQFPKSRRLSRRRVSKRVANVARGIGPQQTADTVTGVWNLYTWEAIQPELALPDPSDSGSSDFWIWNEGIPADIPVFDGRRVILLGPASYPRSWQSQRMFADFPAKLDCVTRLSKDQVTDWLERMAAARRSS